MKTFTLSLFVLLTLGITTHTNAQTNNAINLTGTNYVDAGSTISATSIKTMECWVKFNNFTATQEIISRSTNSVGIELLVYNNTLAFFCMQSPSNVSNVTYPTSSLTAGVWYHIAATWNGTKESMSIYVNGVKVSGAPTNTGDINSTGITNPTGSLRIGQWSDASLGRNLNGTVDEVRIWSINRSASDIKNGFYNPVATNTSGLLAYYNFNEANGNVLDATGNNAAATLVGSPTRVTSPIQIAQNALVFDGVDDQVTAPANSAYNFTNGTVEFWVRPTALAAHPSLQQYLVGVRGASLTRFSFHMSPTQVGLYNGTLYTPMLHTFTDNTWYHLAFVLGASSTEVYINGVDQGAIALGTGTATGQPLTMGYISNTGEALTGALDEVRIWNVQRSGTDINSTMQSTLTGSESGLVGLFSFNQGSASGSNTGLTYALDGTSNNNHGVLTNFALSGTTSNYTLSAPITPLPVVFSYFTGLPSNGSSLLRWQTAQEENSSFFAVERSTDNKTYVGIGRLSAAGNSSLPQSYSFTDQAPGSGTNFYRIRETDLDGKFMYSPVISLNFSTASHADILVYPNPTRQTLNYVVTSPGNNRAQAQITDLSGRLVINSPIQLSAGINSLSLEIRSLVPGIYVLRVVPQSGEPYFTRFQVVR